MSISRGEGHAHDARGFFLAAAEIHVAKRLGPHLAVEQRPRRKHIKLFWASCVLPTSLQRTLRAGSRGGTARIMASDQSWLHLAICVKLRRRCLPNLAPVGSIFGFCREQLGMILGT